MTSAWPKASRTVRASGQCMNAGSSMLPSVPTMRAVQARFTRIEAFATASFPPGWCRVAATVSSTPVVPMCPLATTRSGGSEDERRQLQRVDAEVEQGAAAPGRVEEAVGGVDGHAEAEVGLDEQRLTDATVQQQLPQRDVGGEEPAPDGLHEEALGQVGAGRHAQHLGLGHGQRLLAQHVLAVVEEEAGVVGVAGLRGGDVDDVDVVVVGQGLVVAVAPGDVPLVGERVGPLLGP